MKTMKKIFIFSLLFLLVFLFIGCGDSKEPEPDPGVDPGTDPGSKPQEPTVKKPDVNYPELTEYLDEPSIAIHYIRSDAKYAKWCLWLWDPTGVDDNAEDEFNYLDSDGVIAYYPLSKFGDFAGGKLGIIIKTKGAWTKDGTEADRFIEFNKFEMDENKVYHVYFFGGDAGIYQNKDKTMADDIESALFENSTKIRVVCSNTVASFELYKGETKIKEDLNVNNKSFSVYLDSDADLKESYVVKVKFKDSGETLQKSIALNNLYNTESFNNEFYYDGELGAIYTETSTTFKVWSPVSSKIMLRLYDNGTPTSVSKEKGSDAFLEYEMTKGDKGVFSVKVDGDLHGKYYTYVVTNAQNNGIEIVDPYAKAAGVNGLRGLIVDFSRTNPEGFGEMGYLDYDRKELVVWETHVADVTSNATWTGTEANRRKYLGLIETGTTYTSGDVTVTTGFDHIKELGVNAVQLLPVFDHANDETKYEFNWGYNPLNYNVVEGLYSSDPYDGLVRITELKKVIQAFNEAGITTIMDVVYNHVNGANGSNFDVLMPGYYYRYNSDGSLSNGSGCGNEVASENAMVSKFIVDSCKFWMEEYKFGGFRFDLMGLLDLDTMAKVVEECEKINPNAVIYGEPWQGGSSPLPQKNAAIQNNGNLYQGYGAFNDKMRDAMIKGGLNDKAAKGWITNNEIVSVTDVVNIISGINGETYNSNNSISDPNKNVIYATCHDNYTLYDRIKAAGINNEDTVKKMAVLANALVLTSSGTSFLLAGEEMLRTKQGDSNSYKSDDSINSLDYSLKAKNLDMFETYKTLINFKKTTLGLQLDEPNIEVEKLNNNSILKYTVTSGNDEYLIIHANGVNHGFTIDLSGYELVLDTLNRSAELGEGYSVTTYQTLILKKK